MKSSILLIFLPLLIWSEWGEPVKLPPQINNITDSRNIYHARLSPDGHQLYFTDCDWHTDDDIWVARWNGADWDSVTRLGPQINDDQRNLSPSVTADGKTLYYVSYGRKGGYGGYDVWFSEWDSVAKDWSEPKNCGSNVNTSAMEFTACIAADGKMLFFDRSDDIFCSTWQDTGWGPAENLGPNINTWSYEYSPWISADGKTLYFASWYSNHNGPDIFVSYWTEEGWSKSENLGPPVNLSFGRNWNDSPSLSPDGRTLIFASNRGDTTSWQYLYMSKWVGAVEEKKPDRVYRPIEIYPNPTGSSVKIGFTLPKVSQVKLEILDMLGRKVKTILANQRLEPGSYNLNWDGRDYRNRMLPEGVYFVRLTTPLQTIVKKVILLR